MSKSLHQEADRKAIHQEPGKEMYTFKPKAFEIIWGADDRFWKIHDDVAELIQVYWLEVTGCLEVTPGDWTVKFDVKFKPDAFGWNDTTVMLMAKVGRKGEYKAKKIKLPGSTDATDSPLEINVPDRKDTIFFGLYEMWSGKWKGGLKIFSATVEKKKDNDADAKGAPPV